MNPLEDYPQVRKTLYLVMFVLGAALGAAQVGFGAANVDQPTWLIVTLSVYAFLSSYLGLTAATNLKKKLTVAAP